MVSCKFRNNSKGYANKQTLSQNFLRGMYKLWIFYSRVGTPKFWEFYEIWRYCQHFQVKQRLLYDYETTTLRLLILRVEANSGQPSQCSKTTYSNVNGSMASAPNAACIYNSGSKASESYPTNDEKNSSKGMSDSFSTSGMQLNFVTNFLNKIINLTHFQLQSQKPRTSNMIQQLEKSMRSLVHLPVAELEMPTAMFHQQVELEPLLDLPAVTQLYQVPEQPPTTWTIPVTNPILMVRCLRFNMSAASLLAMVLHQPVIS